MNTMLKLIQSVLFVGVMFFWSAQGAAAAPSYTPFVVAQDIVMRNINGELRFCERANLKGNVCGRMGKFFGKDRFMVQDWWNPETYVAAVTGIPNPTVVNIEPTGDGRGVVIYYQQDY